MSFNPLAEKPSRYAALLAAAVDAVIVIDPNGLILEFNDAAQRLFGYARDAALGRNVKLLMPEPYAANHDGYLHRYNQTGEAKIIGIGREVTARRQDGSVFPADLSVGEAREGEERFFVGIVRDISRQKADQEEIRQSQETLAEILNHAPMGIASCAPDGGFLMVNQTLATLLQRPVDQLVGASLYDQIEPNDRSRVRRLVEALFAQAVSEIKVEVRLSGSVAELHVRLFGGLVFDRNGRPEHMIVQWEDRSAHVLAQREAREQRERLTHVTRLSTLGEMASGIAHEINQPLTAIATYAQAAIRLRQRDRMNELDNALTKISQQAERAAAVIKRLRSFVRQQESEQHVLDVLELVSDTLQFLEMDVGRRHIPVVLDVQPPLPKVLADPIQIQQVLLNLLLNAMDATDSAGRADPIQLQVSQEAADLVRVSVFDAGCGVPEDQRAQLFTPFFTTKAAGMGMGLPICRSIVTAHGGQLTFTPRAEGGSVFSFTLPAVHE